MIGFTAGVSSSVSFPKDVPSTTSQFIVMMFPRPTSSRVFVRKSLAADLDELSHILAAEVEAFLAEERRARDGFYEKVEIVGEGAEAKASPKELRMRKFTPKMLAVSVRPSFAHIPVPVAYFHRRCVFKDLVLRCRQRDWNPKYGKHR